jgi:hypothetical protein
MLPAQSEAYTCDYSTPHVAPSHVRGYHCWYSASWPGATSPVGSDGGPDSGSETNFAAFGYYTTRDPSRPSGYLFTPYYDVFGH